MYGRGIKEKDFYEKNKRKNKMKWMLLYIIAIFIYLSWVIYMTHNNPNYFGAF